MRISDWSSDVCSSDLQCERGEQVVDAEQLERRAEIDRRQVAAAIGIDVERRVAGRRQLGFFLEQSERLWAEPRSECRIAEPIDRDPVTLVHARRVAARLHISEERLVGTAVVRMCSSRWAPYQ